MNWAIQESHSKVSSDYFLSNSVDRPCRPRSKFEILANDTMVKRSPVSYCFLPHLIAGSPSSAQRVATHWLNESGRRFAIFHFEISNTGIRAAWPVSC